MKMRKSIILFVLWLCGMTVMADVTVTFTTEEAGTTKTVGTVSMVDMTLPLNQTSGFTYTYDGDYPLTRTYSIHDGDDIETYTRAHIYQ